MVSKAKFKEILSEAMETYSSMYGKNNTSRLMFLDSYSSMIPGYTRLPGSNQILITHKGKEIFNSDNPLSERQLMDILVKVIDYKKLKMQKKQWVLRVLRTDGDEPRTEYFYADTKKQAEDDSIYMKTLPHFEKIDLVREKIPDQGIYGDRDYEFIKKIK